MEVALTDSAGPTMRTVCCGIPMQETKVVSISGTKNIYECSSCGRTSEASPGKHGVQGSVHVQLIRAETGEVVQELKDNNVFTDVGRNYLAALISYNVLTQAPGADEPAASKRRFDGVRYMMVGTGSQLETNAVNSLVSPVTFNNAGDYLAQVVAPNTLPGTGISAVFQRVFGVNEISMPSMVNITEVGLFPSGPSNSPLSPSVSVHPPIAYKTIGSFPKTTEFLFAVRWEIKF